MQTMLKATLGGFLCQDELNLRVVLHLMFTLSKIICVFEEIKRRSNSTCPILCPRCKIEKGMIVFHCITLQYLCGFSSLLTDSFCLG